LIKNSNHDKFLSVVKASIFTALLVLMAYIGETGRDGGFIKDVWAAAKTASPFAAMFAILAWLSERQDRRASQVELLERTIYFVEATNEQSASIERMTDAIRQVSNVIGSTASEGGSYPRRRRRTKK
jgi:hypothetical protein